jgi:hypothetical protein
MQWYEIIQLVLIVMRILKMIPPEKRKTEELKAYEAIAKVVTENNVA